MPSCPMAMPSSMAMVLNSAAKQPSASIRCLTYCPISCRCTCPGTSWVNELAMPMTGRPNCSSRMPLARHRLLAPAIRRPVVVTALLSGCFIFFLFSAYCAFAICPDNKKPFSIGRKAFLSSFGYTHHLSPVILPKTTSSRLMTLLFEWFWAFMSGISVFVPFQR